MKLDIFDLTACYVKYNVAYFDNMLPIPAFKFRHSYFTLGYFSCGYDRYYNLYNCLLEISDRYDYTEEQLRDIMVHEMIHFYLAYTKCDLRMRHGREFKNMAKTLNSIYGLNITPKIDTTNYKKKRRFSLSYLGACMFG